MWVCLTNKFDFEGGNVQEIEEEIKVAPAAIGRSSAAVLMMMMFQLNPLRWALINYRAIFLHRALRSFAPTSVVQTTYSLALTWRWVNEVFSFFFKYQNLLRCLSTIHIYPKFPSVRQTPDQVRNAIHKTFAGTLRSLEKMSLTPADLALSLA